MIVNATADQVAVLPDGRIVIAMPPAESYDPRVDQYHITLSPPADLVAVTGRCKRCKGRGFTNYMFCEECGGHCIPVPQKRCPDCHAGRPLFDLKVELPPDMAKNEGHHNCIECGGFCALYEAMWSKPCPTCNGTGVVTYAGLYVPGKLLPVYAAIHPCGRPHVEVDKHGEATAYDADCETIWTGRLPTAARPGWYAAIAERSET